MGGNMRLRNKKTGDIIESYIIETASAIGCDLILQDNDTNKHYQYNSLSELNKEWEDYEEPKSGIRDVWFADVIEGQNNITISMSTKEEAERAVEKLKAWKRLKDNGFKFHGWENGKTEYPDCVLFSVLFSGDSYHGDEKDLDLLFGGENE